MARVVTETAVLDALYEAAAERAHIQAALQQLTRYAGLSGAAILIDGNGPDNIVAGVHTWGLPNDAERAYFDEYAQYDLAYRRVAEQQPHRWYDTAGLVTPEEIKQNPFYQEFLPKIGTKVLAGLRVSGAESEQLTIGLHRAPSQENFSAAEFARLSRLIPHFRRFDRLQRISSRLENHTAALESALDRINHALFIIRQGGRIENANQAAEDLLQGHDGLRRRHGRLSIDDASAGERFRSHLAATLRADATGAADITVPRPSGGRDYRLTILPLGPGTFYAGRHGDPMAMVIIANLDQPLAISETRLMKTFGLTLAEARLAMEIGSGQSIEAISTRRRVARSTLRSQLLAVFAKTGTGRQSDLVRLLLQVASARVE
ncbi:MAG: helix-turn-helix transcriptional regulator [Inquilinaceae bacterium]